MEQCVICGKFLTEKEVENCREHALNYTCEQHAGARNFVNIEQIKRMYAEKNNLYRNKEKDVEKIEFYSRLKTEDAEFLFFVREEQYKTVISKEYPHKELLSNAMANFRKWKESNKSNS